MLRSDNPKKGQYLPFSHYSVPDAPDDLMHALQTGFLCVIFRNNSAEEQAQKRLILSEKIAGINSLPC